MPAGSGSSSFVSTPHSWNDGGDDLFYDARSTQGSPPGSSRSARQPSHLGATTFVYHDLHGDDADYQLPPPMPVSRSLLRALSQGGEQVSSLHTRCLLRPYCGLRQLILVL